MAGIKALRGVGRLGRPGASLLASASKEIADDHDRPVPALVLKYVTAKGLLVRLPLRGSVEPGRARIIQPLMDAHSILLNRKSEGYGKFALLAISNFAAFLDALDVQKNSLECIADIDSSTGAAYSRWLQAQRPGKSDNGKFYSLAERSVQLLRSNPNFCTRADIGNEPLKWPRGPRRNEKNHESLDKFIYTGLIRACQRDVDAFRTAFAEKSALEDEAEIIVDADPSLENLAWFVMNACGGVYPISSKRRDPSSVESTRRAAYLANALRQWHGMSVATFRAMFETDEGKRLASLGRSPKNRRPYGRNSHRQGRSDLVLASILKTIRALYPDWPLQCDPTTAMHLFSHAGRHGHLGQAVMQCPSPITGVTGVSGILDSMYPQSHVIWSLFIWSRIQTGWNSETLTSINFDGHSIVDCPLDPENYALIIGNKKRPKSKQVIHRSNKYDRYGIYSILQFLKKITEPIRAATGSECPWQFVRQCNGWERKGFYGSLRPFKTSFQAVRSFFRRHEIHDPNGKKVTSIDLDQLRATYEDARAIKWDGNLRAVSMDMSHESVETTDKYYDSNSASRSRKDEAIAKVQKEVVEHVRHFHGARIEGESRSALSNALPLSTATMKRLKDQMGPGTTEDEVYRVISPDAETYIAVCRNSKNPTWRDHESYVRPGEDCTYFNGCASCRQVVIFDEALPYIAARVFKLDELRPLFTAPQWESDFYEEYAGWTELLDTWQNRQKVSEAKALAASGKVSVPVVMVQ